MSLLFHMTITGTLEMKISGQIKVKNIVSTGYKDISTSLGYKGPCIFLQNMSTRIDKKFLT
jgi:hypothetical protein